MRLLKNQKSSTRELNRVVNKELGSDLLSHAKSILSLAQVRFTALFEMGRGGSKPLLPPSINGNVTLFYKHELINSL